MSEVTMRVCGGGLTWMRVALLGVGLGVGCQAEKPEPATPSTQEDAVVPSLPTGPDTPQPGDSPPTPSQPPPPVVEQGPDARRPSLRTSFYAGVAPRGLAVGDFNGDGAPDVAINVGGRNYSSQYVSRKGEILVLLNDRRGALETVATRQQMWSSSGVIAVGDADGDGHSDVLAGTLRGMVLARGLGDGTFMDTGGMFGGTYGGAFVNSLGFARERGGESFFWFLTTETQAKEEPRPMGFSNFTRLYPGEPGKFRGGSFVTPDGQPLIYGLADTSTVALGDFNEDGHLDVVFSTAQEGNKWREDAWQAQLFLANASGQMLPHGLLPMKGTLSRVEVADFNQDGHLDLIGLGQDALWFFPGTGQGNFPTATSLPLETPTPDFAVVQLDSDGFPGVVALHPATHTVSLFKGRKEGVPALHAVLAVGRAPSAAATADLDGDGRVELLVTEEDDNTVSVYAIPPQPVRQEPVASWCGLDAQPGAATLLPPVAPLATVETGSGGTSAAIGDFNSDGRADLAFALPMKGLRWVFNKGEGRFSVEDHAMSHGAVSLAAGDFDGDGRVDLAGTFRRLTSSEPPGRESFVAISWNEETAPFSQLEPQSMEGYVTTVVAEDFDGDGRTDLALALDPGCGSLAMRLTHLGQRTFRQDRLTDYNGEPDDKCPHSGRLMAADLNGDGTRELIHSTLGININPTSAQGTTLPGYGVVDRGMSLPFMAAVDADGDGRVDLIRSRYEARSVLLYPGDGTGSLRAPLVCALPVTGEVRAVEDLNADGLPDVLDTLPGDAGLGVVLGRGRGTWSAPRHYLLEAPVDWVRAVDLMGDARPELVVLLRTGRLLVFPTPEA